MNKLGLSLVAFTLPLTACATTSNTSSGAVGAGLGAAAGAGIAAATGQNLLAGAAVGAIAGAGAGVLLNEMDRSSPIEGDVREGVCTRRDATPGNSVPGVPGAAWADLDNDSCVDGYILNGRYYRDTPQR